jgi:hypothetical protein
MTGKQLAANLRFGRTTVLGILKDRIQQLLRAAEQLAAPLGPGTTAVADVVPYRLA